MITTVLFDLFETLVTESPVRPARASASWASLSLEREAFRAEWRIRRPRVVLGQMSFVEALAEISRTVSGRVDLDAVRSLRARRVREKAAVFARVSDEVALLVSDLERRGVALGVVSNVFEEDVLAWPSWPLAPKFGCALFSFAEGIAKPDPEIYLRAVRRLGGGPATTLFVGDGADNELTGAEQAGLRTFRATWFTAGHRVPDSIDGILETP